jgi:TrmH family RNA methyltransferase
MERRAVRLRVVLVEPQDPRNIGAVCRAMKTMGLHELTLVAKQGVQLREAAITAVHAADVLEAAVIRSGLAEAVGDAALAAGITRRRGKRRKYFALFPEQLAERIASLEGATCALVFGNEVSGLTDEELSHCHLAVQIPSSPGFPSLNLSHAVQIVAYELFRRLAEPGSVRVFRPISQQKLDWLTRIILGALRNIGFFSQGDAEEMGVFFRDILARAALEHREAERLAKVFRKISGLVAQRGIDP